MAYDLEEQEQLAALKAWWNQYGNFLTWLLIAVLAGYAAWSGWNYYQRGQTVKAAQLYEQLQKAAAAGDNAKVQRAATDATEKFAGTAYAQMAALAAAKSAYDAHDIKTARQQLQWVIEHGASDDYKALARIRLAGILLDEKAYDAAHKTLSVDMPAAFAGAIADREGDILVAEAKLDEARAAYKRALEKTDEKDPARQLIQLKLDAIGGGGAEKAAA